MSTEDFYNKIAPFYDLIYPDWENSLTRQADNLSSIIKASELSPSRTILDVSCGIGTQALGLSRLGFKVTGSDLSAAEIDRARDEAKKRNLNIDFSICDMRAAKEHHKGEYDVVLSADNSIPHLLSDTEILSALKQFHALTKIGGLCILTVRDYENEELVSDVIKPYAVRSQADGKYIMFQVWEVDGEIYETSMYYVKDLKNGACESMVARSKYYAISTTKLISLMKEAGFENVIRKDGVFFQPVLLGIRTN